MANSFSMGIPPTICCNLGSVAPGVADFHSNQLKSTGKTGFSVASIFIRGFLEGCKTLKNIRKGTINHNGFGPSFFIVVSGFVGVFVMNRYIKIAYQLGGLQWMV